jgi:type IV pilus assembly protein PilC
MPTNADKPGAGIKRVRRAPKKIQMIEENAPVESAPPPATVEVITPVLAPPQPSRISFRGGIRKADITTFLRQLIMLLDAGTPILKSLRSLAERGEKMALRALIADIAEYVEMGNPLWQAFERHPRHFDTVFVNLIKASEASGTLTTVLSRTVKYRERREILTKRVRGAMFYPAILLFACFAAVLFICWVVLPEFETMFTKFNVQLPTMTVYFLVGARLFAAYWWLAVVAFAGLVALYKLWYVQNPVRRVAADRFKLHLPIIGQILRKNAVVEMTRTLALLLKSGLSMMSTLELVRSAIHNRAVAQTIQTMRDSVERGSGLEQPLRAASDIIPTVVADMLVTGEESGRLDSIAEQIADTYEEEVNISLSTLGDALQPILTVFLGALVIIVMLAVFVPLLNLVNTMGAGAGA